MLSSVTRPPVRFADSSFVDQITDCFKGVIKHVANNSVIYGSAGAALSISAYVLGHARFASSTKDDALMYNPQTKAASYASQEKEAPGVQVYRLKRYTTGQGENAVATPAQLFEPSNAESGIYVGQEIKVSEEFMNALNALGALEGREATVQRVEGGVMSASVVKEKPPQDAAEAAAAPKEFDATKDVFYLNTSLPLAEKDTAPEEGNRNHTSNLLKMNATITVDEAFIRNFGKAFEAVSREIENKNRVFAHKFVRATDYTKSGYGLKYITKTLETLRIYTLLNFLENKIIAHRNKTMGAGATVAALSLVAGFTASDV